MKTIRVRDETYTRLQALASYQALTVDVIANRILDGALPAKPEATWPPKTERRLRGDKNEA